MMSPTRGLALLLLVQAACLTLAQRPVPSIPVIPPPKSAGGNIVLDVVVASKAKHADSPVTGLQQSDFTVLDNNHPQPIASFRALDNKAPVEVILLIDAVNTAYTNIPYERQQIDKFLRQNNGHLAAPTALAVLTDPGLQIQPTFTTDGNALSAALEKYTVSLRSIGRAAGFYGATDRFEISLNAIRLLSQREASRPGRKIVIWASPGWPLLSGPAVDLSAREEQSIFSDIVSLSTLLRDARITLYAVNPLGLNESVLRTFYYQEFLKGVPDARHIDIGDIALQVLAVHSGGLVLNSSNDISALLAQCLADTNSFYEISYPPPHAEKPDEYHHIAVQLSQPGLIARTRDSYYLQP